MTTDVIWLTTTTLSIGLALLALKTEMVELAVERVPVKTKDIGFENLSIERGEWLMPH